jgi:hypothetical protein
MLDDQGTLMQPIRTVMYLMASDTDMPGMLLVHAFLLCQPDTWLGLPSRLMAAAIVLTPALVLVPAIGCSNWSPCAGGCQTAQCYTQLPGGLLHRGSC